MESFQTIVSKRILQNEPMLLLAIAVIFNYLQLPYSDKLSVFIFGLVGILYYFTQFAFIQNEKASGFDNFFNKIAALSSSILVIGILFKMLHWSGATPMLLVGLLSMASSIIYVLLNLKKIEDGIFGKWLFLRMVVLLLLGLANGYQLFM